MKEKQYCKREKQALVKKFERSGLAVSRFCLQEGITQSLFRKWLFQYQLAPFGGDGFVHLRFIEVEGSLFPILIP